MSFILRISVSLALLSLFKKRRLPLPRSLSPSCNIEFLLFIFPEIFHFLLLNDWKIYCFSSSSSLSQGNIPLSLFHYPKLSFHSFFSNICIDSFSSYFLFVHLWLLISAASLSPFLPNVLFAVSATTRVGFYSTLVLFFCIYITSLFSI